MSWNTCQKIQYDTLESSIQYVPRVLDIPLHLCHMSRTIDVDRQLQFNDHLCHTGWVVHGNKGWCLETFHLQRLHGLYNSKLDKKNFWRYAAKPNPHQFCSSKRYINMCRIPGAVFSVREKFFIFLQVSIYGNRANANIFTWVHTRTHTYEVGRATLITSLNKRGRGHLFLAKTVHSVIKLSHDYI